MAHCDQVLIHEEGTMFPRKLDMNKPLPLYREAFRARDIRGVFGDSGSLLNRGMIPRMQ